MKFEELSSGNSDDLPSSELSDKQKIQRLFSKLRPYSWILQHAIASQAKSKTHDKFIRIVVLFFLFLNYSVLNLMANPIQANVFYVSQRGDDRNDGSLSQPWKSIQRAVDELKAGDTLFITEGIYEESADLKSSGNEKAYITLEGVGHVVIQGKNLYEYESVFETKGNDYIRFKNFIVEHARSAVEIGPGSRFIEVDDLKTDHNDFAVKIKDAQHIRISHVYAINSRQAFYVEGSNSHHILFEESAAYNSKDVYAGYRNHPHYYLDGDGFLLEEGHSIILRHVVTGDHWDAGIEVKASNVVMEDVLSYGNKNNFKISGKNIVIKDALSSHARAQQQGMAWEGNGLRADEGSVKLINVTFKNNEKSDVQFINRDIPQIQNHAMVNFGE